jgi:AraC-like DNA-binding protein/mannose-6-phosphate isomerase-like protein (cupin superfamily)
MARRKKAPRRVTEHVVWDNYEMWMFPLPREIAEIEYLGRQVFRQATDLPTHAHPGALEILLVEQGQVVLWSGHEIHEVAGGHAFVNWPGEVHGGIDRVLNPCKLYWICVTFPEKPPKGYLGIPAKEARALQEGLRRLPRRCFPAGKSLPRRYDRILDLLAGGPKPLVAPAVRSELVTILCEVIELGRAAGGGEARTARIEKAISLMGENLDRPLSVAELARRVGWSENHFRTRFRKETGLLPGEFYLRRRVSLARERIAGTDVPLVWIALDLGFGSSQYMATCFRRITGRSPSSFRPPDGERARRPRTGRRYSSPSSRAGCGRGGAE